MLKSAQTELLDVLIDAKILDDTTGPVAEGSAHTGILPGRGWSYQTPTTDKHDKITAFNGKFEWRSTITIQTTYKPGRDPSDLSCYGRGTTDTDVRRRDITLGFHENCHRSDIERYLKAHPLPDPPEMNLGMTGHHYDLAVKKFGDAVDAYFQNISAFSVDQTDEVGFKRSRAIKTKDCFNQIVP